jgi:hypothetical protein
MSAAASLAHAIDLERYPIDDLDGPRRPRSSAAAGTSSAASARASSRGSCGRTWSPTRSAACPADSPLRAVYESEVLTRFVGPALEVEPIHPGRRDRRAQRHVLRRGDELGWHVDNADFVVTLMLQPSISGGAFRIRADAPQAR